MKKDIHEMTRLELIALVEELRSHAQEDADLRTVVQEIQSFQNQIRLERKEEASSLRSAELERDQFADLIEFAPVGFLTLDVMGLIRSINLTGAAMLGTERSRLIDTPMLSHVDESSRRDFLDHLQHCRHESGTVSLQIKMKPVRGGALEVRLSTRAGAGGGAMRTILTDMNVSAKARRAISEDDSQQQYGQGN